MSGDPLGELKAAESMQPKGALFSDDRRHRYLLWRRWALGVEFSDLAVFIGLNPSTADEQKDDPTIRRCIGFAKAWGFPGLMMLNAFAYRATLPVDMFAQSDPVGLQNDFWINWAAGQSRIVVAAWGVHGAHRGRQDELRAMLAANGVKLHHLGLTKHGFPKHPLYLPKTSVLTEWVY